MIIFAFVVLLLYLVIGVGNVIAKAEAGFDVTQRTIPLSILLWPVELYRTSRFSSKGPF